MILDTLDNIDIYKELSNDIYVGLIFLQRLEIGILPGLYPHTLVTLTAAPKACQARSDMLGGG